MAPDVNTRPDFYLPFPSGTKVALKSYVGHNPDHMKIDMYAEGWPNVHVSAPGYVHEAFYPGGVEVRHYIPGTKTPGNWYTTYMHMESHVPVGTVLQHGDRLGTADSVGTWVKHLHFEQLHDASGSGNADTNDMVYPAFVELNDGKAFSMPLGEPGLHGVSKNSRHLNDKPPVQHSGGSDSGGKNEKIYQGANVPDLIREGSGQYLGLISGPAASHGGVNADEQRIVRMLQRRLIDCGFVPGVRNPRTAWADGKFTKPTKDAVTRFQLKHMPGTKYFGQVWADDWKKLFNL